MHTRTLSAATLVAAALATTGCVRQLPPPEAPAREISQDLRTRAAELQAPEGRGIVVLDVTEGEATVTDLGSEGDGAGRREVCTTPCVTDLSLGEHRVVFNRGGRSDEVTLNVEETPLVHRRTMSYDSGSHTEYSILATFGLGIGGLTTAFLIDPLSQMGGNLTMADGALITAAVLGGALFTAGLVGVILAIVDPRAVREGASTEWRLELP
jgi:hypothetical protein